MLSAKSNETVFLEFPSQRKGQAWEFPGKCQQKLATNESLTYKLRAQVLVPRSSFDSGLCGPLGLAWLGPEGTPAPAPTGHLLSPVASVH